MQFTLQTLLLSFVVVASALAAFDGWGVLAAAVILAVAAYVRSSQSLWLAMRNVFTLFVLGACLLELLLPTVSHPGKPTSRVVCHNNMKHIELALHSYHEKHGHFPPAYILGPDGKPWHSWRTLLLPYFERKDLYDQYRFDEPWEGPNNIKLASVPLRLFACPSVTSPPAAQTHYVAVVGAETMWPGAKTVSLHDIPDGPSYTIHLVEVNQGIPWSEPRDISFTELCSSMESQQQPLIATRHEQKADTCFVRYGQGRVAHVTTADGAVHQLNAETPLDVWRALLTRAGDEAIDPRWEAPVPRPHWGHIGGLVCLVLSTLLLIFRPIRRSAAAIPLADNGPRKG